MKLANRVLGVLSAILIIAGAIVFSINLPLARLLLIFGGFGAFLFPLRLWLIKSKSDALTFNRIVGYLAFTFIISGALFKMLHIEGANLCLVSGTAVLVMQFLPVYLLLDLGEEKTAVPENPIPRVAPVVNEPVEKESAHETVVKAKELDSLAVPTMQGLIIVKTIEISHCEADDKYTRIFVDGKKMMLASQTLGYFEDLLKDSGFIRIHNSYLINLKHLKNYIKGEGGQVVMSNDVVLDVSRRKKTALLDAISNPN